VTSSSAEHGRRPPAAFVEREPSHPNIIFPKSPVRAGRLADRDLPGRLLTTCFL